MNIKINNLFSDTERLVRKIKRQWMKWRNENEWKVHIMVETRRSIRVAEGDKKEQKEKKDFSFIWSWLKKDVYKNILTGEVRTVMTQTNR